MLKIQISQSIMLKPFYCDKQHSNKSVNVGTQFNRLLQIKDL